MLLGVSELELLEVSDTDSSSGRSSICLLFSGSSNLCYIGTEGQELEAVSFCHAQSVHLLQFGLVSVDYSLARVV
jgi:hypothetical protein